MAPVNSSEPIDVDKIDFMQLFRSNVQTGGGADASSPSPYAYIGFPYQRGGGGIGGVLKRFRRSIPSFLASPVGKEVTSSIASVAADLAHGSTPTEALKRAGKRSLHNLTGLGKRRRPQAPKRSLFLPAP